MVFMNRFMGPLPHPVLSMQNTVNKGTVKTKHCQHCCHPQDSERKSEEEKNTLNESIPHPARQGGAVTRPPAAAAPAAAAAPLTNAAAVAAVPALPTCVYMMCMNVVYDC